MYSGKLIALEGPDLAGKSKQIREIAPYLLETDHPLFTKEPTERTEASREIRRLLKQGIHPRDNAELFLKLFVEDRKQHQEIYMPLLKWGITVISDRHFLSTYVYQNAQGVSLDRIRDEHTRNNIYYPDLTILIKISLDELIRRKNAREGFEEVFEEVFEKYLGFQDQIINKYMELARTLDQNIVIVDGEQSPRSVGKEIKLHIDNLLNND